MTSVRTGTEEISKNPGREEEETTVAIGIPTLMAGGTEIQTLTIARALISGGYRVVVCCYHEYLDDVVETFQESGIDVRLLRIPRPEKLLGLFALIPKLAREYRKMRPDVAHIQYMAPGLLAVLAARIAGVRVVFATVHQPGRTYGIKARMLLRVAAKMSKAFQCISLSVEKSWFGTCSMFDSSSAIRLRHFTIYNAVDAKEIARCADMGRHEGLRLKLGLDKCLVIGCTGRLRTEKGQMFLIEAMTRVAGSLPSARLLLIGDGPDSEGIANKIDELGLQEIVIRLGGMNHNDAMRHLGAMDVMAIPSLFEGFGLVAAESMASGLPVVASNVDGLAEVIVHGETGMLVPPRDCEALAEALIFLLTDPKARKQYSENAVTRIEKLFSIERFSESMLGMYQAYTPKWD